MYVIHINIDSNYYVYNEWSLVEDRAVAPFSSTDCQHLSANYFGFSACNFTVFSLLFQYQQLAAVFSEKALINSLYTTCPAPYSPRQIKLATC